MTPERKKQIMENAKNRVEDLKRLQKAGLICKQGDFFPSVHYPPITMYPPATQDELFKTYTLPEDGLFDIYAHIPFCQQRCVYCHYPLLLGKKQENEKDRYLTALEKEMDIYMAQLGINSIKARSILVGGGTPTFLTLKQLERFLKFFTQRVDLSNCKQFNYDLDPNSIIGSEGLERLRMMKDYGVNRLTIGSQSLNDEILKLMNRHHNSEEVIKSIRNAQEFGYQVDIEFIFGFPGQTLDNWIEVMEKAVTLDTEEIQLYRLKVEAYGDHQGPIDKMIQKHPELVPTVEKSIMMKQLAIDILADHGYNENLRRVFTRKKEHISLYAYDQCCMLYDEIGFGLTAFSSLRDRFVLNTQFFDEYYAKIEEGKLPLNRGLVRSQDDQCRWAIVLPLKNWDIHKKYYKKVTGVPIPEIFLKELEKLKKYGLVEESDTHFKLTKLGAFFADEVVEHFHNPQYMPFPLSDYEHGDLTPITSTVAAAVV